MFEEWRGDTKCSPDHCLHMRPASHSYKASLVRHPAPHIVLLFFPFTYTLTHSGLHANTHAFTQTHNGMYTETKGSRTISDGRPWILSE